MPPGDSPPERTAPKPLDLVQRFVNTIDLETGEDELTSPELLRDWLAERGLVESSVTAGAADLRRALDVREGLRAVLQSNNGVAFDAGRVERLEKVAARARLRVCFVKDGGPELAPECSGVDGAIARLMAIVAAAAESGEWQRLKSCPRDTCFWAFYDHSKNRSGRWCSMESCGNIEKAKAFRERRRAGKGAGGSRPRNPR